MALLVLRLNFSLEFVFITTAIHLFGALLKIFLYELVLTRWNVKIFDIVFNVIVLISKFF